MRDVRLAPVFYLFDLISGKKRAGRGVVAERARLEQPLNFSAPPFTKAETGKSSMSMHIINLGEVFYRLCRVSGTKRGEEILERIRMLPIHILSISDEEVMAAAKIKAKYP
jgi:hypothetical protein